MSVCSTESQEMSLQDHLDALITNEGAGSWPPTPSYVDSWPTQLAPYHTIALAAPPRFVDSSDIHPVRRDDQLAIRISENRQWLAQQLAESVDVETVMHLLPGMDVGSRCGFLACLAYLAHLYRWGTLPVVRIAQDEKELLGMPHEIRRPFGFLQEEYGLETNGGSLYTMTLLNIDGDSNLVYSNIRHLAERFPTAWDAERLNASIFYEMERLALPLYKAIAQLPDATEPTPLLAQATASVRAAFQLFAQTVKEGKLKKDVWMSHAQGFHGWGVDGFDGVSGDHSLLIRTLDAFLEIPIHTSPPPATWFSSLKNWWYGVPRHAIHEIPYSNSYLPAHQIAWLSAVRSANLRTKLSAHPEISQLVQQLKLWRLGHTRKAVYYEDLNLPERRPMTASGGVMGGVVESGEGDAGEMIRQLEVRLRARVEATK